LSNTSDATHNSAQLFGMKTFAHRVRMIEKQATSDGEGTAYDAVGFEVEGDVEVDSVNSYNQALAAPVSNLVINNRNEGGAATRVITAKNAKFMAADGNVPGTDGNGMAVWRLRWRGSAGASDTADTMVTEAAGA
jgi:hypothetical protein